MEEMIKNKVAESGIITLNLEDFFPKEEVVMFDIKDYLFMGLILKEKEFRQAIKEMDLSKYQEKNVAVTCSADAIVPMWAYIQIRNIRKIDNSIYADKRVVIKGCGEEAISEEAYLEITNMLKPVVKSIMYGEPCSTVPVYKKP